MQPIILAQHGNTFTSYRAQDIKCPRCHALCLNYTGFFTKFLLDVFLSSAYKYQVTIVTIIRSGMVTGLNRSFKHIECFIDKKREIKFLKSIELHKMLKKLCHVWIFKLQYPLQCNSVHLIKK